MLSNNLQKLEPIGQINIRTKDKKSLKELGSYFEIDFPVEVNLLSENKQFTILALGPDEWLCLLPYDRVKKTMKDLEKMQNNNNFYLVDLSDNRSIFNLSGDDAKYILSHFCAINLDELGEGKIAQTLFAKAQIILQSLGENNFKIYIRNSFANYFEEMIGKLHEIEKLNK